VCEGVGGEGKSLCGDDVPVVQGSVGGVVGECRYIAGDCKYDEDGDRRAGNKGGLEGKISDGNGG